MRYGIWDEEDARRNEKFNAIPLVSKQRFRSTNQKYFWGDGVIHNTNTYLILKNPPQFLRYVRTYYNRHQAIYKTLDCNMYMRQIRLFYKKNIIVYDMWAVRSTQPSSSQPKLSEKPSTTAAKKQFNFPRIWFLSLTDWHIYLKICLLLPITITYFPFAPHVAPQPARLPCD